MKESFREIIISKIEIFIKEIFKTVISKIVSPKEYFL